MPDNIRPILTRRTILSVAVETTHGTAAYETSTALVGDFEDIRFGLDDVTAEGRRMPSGHYLGNYPATIGKQTGTLTFRQPISHTVAFQTLLRGCGYRISSGSIPTATMVPASNLGQRSTLSFQAWEIGDASGTASARVKRMYGAVGTCVIEMTRGAKAFANWTFRGVWDSLDTDDTTIPTLSLSALPYMCQGMTATFAGSASSTPFINRVAIDLGNTLEEIEDVTSAKGVSHWVITERDMTLQADPESRLKASLDNYATSIAGTTIAISVVLSNGSNSLTFTIPAAQRRQITESTRGNRRVDELLFGLCASSGDDELTIVGA